MPTFVKVLIGLVVLVFVGIAALVVWGVLFWKENFNPNHVAKVAREMMVLTDPLPEGWEYGVALDVGYERSVNMRKALSGTTNALVQFSETQIPRSRHRSAKDIAAKFLMPNAAGMRFELEERGEEEIAGRTAYYVREHGIIFGKQSAMEIIMVDLPGGGVMQIQSTEDGLTKFDSSITKPLLDSVKSFHGVRN